MPTLRRLLLGLAAGGVAMLATAAPASAHDELIASDPATDQVLTSAPASVSLSFTGDLLDVGAGLAVVDGDGHDWVVAEPVIDGPEITAELDVDMPDAGYELRWRVVSSDGHPISGVVPFTVGDGEPLVRAEPAGDDGGAGTDDGGGGTADGATSGADAGTDASGTGQDSTVTQDGGVLRTVLVGASGAVVAVCVLLVIQILRRRGPAPGARPRPMPGPDTDLER